MNGKWLLAGFVALACSAADRVAFATSTCGEDGYYCNTFACPVGNSFSLAPGQACCQDNGPPCYADSSCSQTVCESNLCGGDYDTCCESGRTGRAAFGVGCTSDSTCCLGECVTIGSSKYCCGDQGQNGGTTFCTCLADLQTCAGDNAECCSGLCQDGVCVTKDGNYCQSNADCKSNVCSQGLCLSCIRPTNRVGPPGAELARYRV